MKFWQRTRRSSKDAADAEVALENVDVMQVIISKEVMKILSCQTNEVITICPDVMGGLPTRRTPSEIVDGVVTAKDGRITDREYRLGAEKSLEIALREKPDMIILL